MLHRRDVILILLLAVGVRSAAFVGLACWSGGLLQSAHDEHAQIAKNLALSHGFRFNFFGDADRPDLTSQQAPWVPMVLAAAYSVFGIESPAALQFVVIIQLLATAVAAGLLADAASHGAGRSSGLIVGVFAAVYPPFALAGCHLQALPWNLCWLAMLLAGTVRCCAFLQPHNESKSRRNGAALFILGAVGGLHTDPILGAVVVGLLACIASLFHPEICLSVPCDFPPGWLSGC